jgi:hypothetical protein
MVTVSAQLFDIGKALRATNPAGAVGGGLAEPVCNSFRLPLKIVSVGFGVSLHSLRGVHVANACIVHEVFWCESVSS